MSEDTNNIDPPPRRRFPVFIVVIVVLFVAPFFLPIRAIFEGLIVAVDHLGPWGPIALIGIHGVIVLVLAPNSWPIVTAGMLFGPWFGAIVGWCGSMLGGLLAVLVGRGFARGWVERRLAANPRGARVDAAVAAKGWKVVAVVRLSPFVPYALLNYVLGLSKIRIPVLMIVTGICIIPSAILYAWFGAIGRAGLDGESMMPTDALDWIILSAGIAMTTFAAWYVRRVVADALKESAQEA